MFVDHRVAPSAKRGRWAVGELARQAASAAEHASLLGGGLAASLPLLFFDLETTGLNGGAGTYAFLVGCGWFDADGAFITRQYVLTRVTDEPAMLRSVRDAFSQAGTLVTFNGKSFDAPVLETRYLFHRLEWSGGQLPHLDVLHVARRFWGGGDAVPPGGFSSPAGDCSLGALERDVLGAGRVGDVPGFEIPARYFQFVRSGDARPLRPVLEHNRLDLLSLAALTARLLDLVRMGPDAVERPREATALGRAYARAGDLARAATAFERALALTAGNRTGSAVRIDALRSLALVHRRARRHDDAADCWRRLLSEGCPASIKREACEALAIHHEHRVRDLAAARSFALRSLEARPTAGWQEIVQHRLARIERRLEKQTGAASGDAMLEL